MDLQTAAHIATLVTTGILVVASIAGLPTLWWRRRKENHRALEALNLMAPATKGSNKLIVTATEAYTNTDKDSIANLSAQMVAMQAYLSEIRNLLFWHFALTHGRTSQLPDWLKKVLDHE